MKKSNLNFLIIITFLIFLWSCSTGEKSGQEKKELVIEKEISSQESTSNQKAITGKVTTEKQTIIDTKSDKYLHQNPPKSYTGNDKIVTYKYFQIVKDDNHNFKELRFWDEKQQKYGKQINIDVLNPYQAVTKYAKVWDTDQFSQLSSIYFDISNSPYTSNVINQKYPPNYAKDWTPYVARLESHWEEMYNNWDKEIIVLNFMLEIYNKHSQVLGHQSTIFLFNSKGEKLNSFEFNLPLYNACTDSNGSHLGFGIGGFWGHNFEVIYPETFRIYNIKSNKFLFEQDDFLGMSKGGGYVDGKFSFGFENGNNVKKIVIDVNKKIYREKIFTKKEYKKLKRKADGYYYKETDQPAYLFEQDFESKKF